MRELGASAVPAVVTRLHSDWIRSHRNASAGIQERFIGALRWCGDAGAEALIDRWGALDDYGRSLACVALGLLDAQSAADRLWTFFESTRSTPTTHWIGPLWGLIDLADARAADALLELMLANRPFYERYGCEQPLQCRRPQAAALTNAMKAPRAGSRDPMCMAFVLERARGPGSEICPRWGTWKERN
jgi:hypothetical protein